MSFYQSFKAIPAANAAVSPVVINKIITSTIYNVNPRNESMINDYRANPSLILRTAPIMDKSRYRKNADESLVFPKREI